MSRLKLLMRRLGAVALIAVLTAASANAEEGKTVFADKSRIVSIGGSITEIVFALGEEGRLIARDSTSIYPEAALKLPDVGYMRALSPEGVLSVNPSGILALADSGPKEAVDVLKKASVPFIEVPETFDSEGIIEKSGLSEKRSAPMRRPKRWRIRWLQSSKLPKNSPTE
jgi:iron complex transport system substrate-binding protein